MCSTTDESTAARSGIAIGNCSGGFYGGVGYSLSVGGLSPGRCYTEGYVIGRVVAGL